jgi:hypothetical protein
MTGLDDARANRLERDLAEFFATEAKGGGASRRASGPVPPESRPSDTDDAVPAGAPPSYELEYLLVRARVPALR